MKMAGPLMAMTPMGKLAGLAGGALGALGGGGGGGIAGDVLAAGAGAAAGYALGGRGGGGGMMGGAPGGSSGGSGPITINNPPVKVNIQISGKDMAASSGVFAEEIGVPGMTDNTMGGGGGGGDDGGGGGGILGSARGAFGGKGKEKSKGGGFSKAKGMATAGAGSRRKGRYTEEFSGSELIPQLEESDAPLLTFALIAILISLLCN